MKRKRGSKAHLRDLAQKIQEQRRRAARPALPVNAHAPVSKSLREKKESLERKRAQRKQWEED
jgi:hypothetical protein